MGVTSRKTTGGGEEIREGREIKEGKGGRGREDERGRGEGGEKVEWDVGVIGEEGKGGREKSRVSGRWMS